MKRAISNQVVVITGASSGIGRECALRFARRGATVVAAARGVEALKTLAAFDEPEGGRIVAVPTDVSDWGQVESLARTAVERFGRIDTWVNAAAVTMYATVADSTVEEIDRILAVNLHGQVHGTKAALTAMREQGRGTIINVASVLSFRAIPLQAAYVASKHGVQGFTETLRMELAREGAQIDVTLIAPSSIDTPLFQHARSKLGVMPKPIEPVYEAGAVADAVLFAAESSRREIVVGGAGKLLIVLQRLSPRLVDGWMVRGGRYFEAQKSPFRDDGRDNLFAPVEGPGAVRGLFSERALSNSLYTNVMEYHPALRALTAAAVAPVIAASVAVALSPVAIAALPIAAFFAGARLIIERVRIARGDRLEAARASAPGGLG